MIQDISLQARIVALRNELLAQKSYTEVPLGALALPSATPHGEWSGSIALKKTGTIIGNNLIHRWRARFQRNDGKTIAPFVNFAFDWAVDKNMYNYYNEHGGTASANDPLGIEEAEGIEWYIAGAGDGHVDFYVDIYEGFNIRSGADNTEIGYDTVNFSLAICAYSQRAGTLSLEKIV